MNESLYEDKFYIYYKDKIWSKLVERFLICRWVRKDNCWATTIRDKKPYTHREIKTIDNYIEIYNIREYLPQGTTFVSSYIESEKANEVPLNE